MTRATLAKQIPRAIVPREYRPYRVVCRTIDAIAEQRIVAGPFAGKKCLVPGPGTERAYHAKLLGTYEMELGGVIERICQSNFARIVNVGAGEGREHLEVIERLLSVVETAKTPAPTPSP